MPNQFCVALNNSCMYQYVFVYSHDCLSSTSTFKADIKWMLEEVSKLKTDIVVSHGDTRWANIIYDEKTSKDIALLLEYIPRHKIARTTLPSTCFRILIGVMNCLISENMQLIDFDFCGYNYITADICRFLSCGEF